MLGTFCFQALETCGGKYSTEPAIRFPAILATKNHNPKQGCKLNSLPVTQSWHKAHILSPLKEVGPPIGSHPDSPVETGQGFDIKEQQREGAKSLVCSLQSRPFRAQGSCTRGQTCQLSCCHPLTPLCPGFANQQAALRQGDSRVPEDCAALLQADP